MPDMQGGTTNLISPSDLNTTLSNPGNPGQTVSIYDKVTGTFQNYTYVDSSTGWVKNTTNSNSSSIGNISTTISSVSDLNSVNNPTNGQTIQFFDNNSSTIKSYTYANGQWQKTASLLDPTSVPISGGNSNNISLNASDIVKIGNQVANVVNALYFRLDGYSDPNVASNTCNAKSTPCQLSVLNSKTIDGSYIKILGTDILNGTYLLDHSLTIDISNIDTTGKALLFKQTSNNQSSSVYQNGKNYDFGSGISLLLYNNTGSTFNGITASPNLINASVLCILQSCTTDGLDLTGDFKGLSLLNVDTPLVGRPGLKISNNMQINIISNGKIFGEGGTGGNGFITSYCNNKGGTYVTNGVGTSARSVTGGSTTDYGNTTKGTISDVPKPGISGYLVYSPAYGAGFGGAASGYVNQGDYLCGSGGGYGGGAFGATVYYVYNNSWRDLATAQDGHCAIGSLINNLTVNVQKNGATIPFYPNSGTGKGLTNERNGNGLICGYWYCEFSGVRLDVAQPTASHTSNSTNMFCYY